MKTNSPSSRSYSRIGKTALAAAISWEVSQRIGSAHPFFAPLAAILCLQVTVEDSILKGYQRILGIVGGVLLATVASRFMGVSSWSIGLLTLLAMGIAKLFRFGDYAFSQVAVSALLVLTVGKESHSYGLDRLVETVIGAATAILINMFILPADYTKERLCWYITL